MQKKNGSKLKSGKRYLQNEDQTVTFYSESPSLSVVKEFKSKDGVTRKQLTHSKSANRSMSKSKPEICKESPTKSKREQRNIFDTIPIDTK